MLSVNEEERRGQKKPRSKHFLADNVKSVCICIPLVKSTWTSVAGIFLHRIHDHSLPSIVFVNKFKLDKCVFAGAVFDLALNRAGKTSISTENWHMLTYQIFGLLVRGPKRHF